jgi:hypothetical protein
VAPEPATTSDGARSWRGCRTKRRFFIRGWGRVSSGRSSRRSPHNRRSTSRGRASSRLALWRPARSSRALPSASRVSADWRPCPRRTVFR